MDLSIYTSSCFREDSPPCTAACPLRVDVPRMLEKIRKKRVSAAFREYRNAVLFPNIVSSICPGYCQSACVRARKDRALNIPRLERYVAQESASQRTERFNVQKKSQHIAVVGAGLSGLGCALRLAQRNYIVSVFDRSSTLGGSLREQLVPEVLAELTAAFSDTSCHFFMEHEIHELSELNADAIYIATGQKGNDFGLSVTTDSNSLGTAQSGVFLGGSLLGTDAIHALEHGMRASHSIEKYLKVGAMDGIPETYEFLSVNPHIYQINVPSCLENTGQDEPEWAAQETQRCAGCRCELCYNSCDLMQSYNRTPRRIAMDATSSLQPVKQLTGRINSRLVYSCNQCGLCQQVCPEHVNTGEILIQARQQFHRDNAIPPAFYDYWRKDMEHALSEKASILLTSESGTTDYLFFPGCQLSASDPKLTLRSYELLRLRLPHTGIWLGCCGIPAQWAGDQERFSHCWDELRHQWENAGHPTLVFACTSCQKTFSQLLPKAKCLSLYPLLQGGLCRPAPWQKMALFDPCANRYDPSAGAGVRALLRECGVEIHELTHHEATAQCCGFGGHIYAANRKLAEQIAAKRTRESDLPYVVYCANFRDIFSAAGKDSVHILELLSDTPKAHRRPPHLEQRRKNREWLRRQLTGQPEEPPSVTGIDIPEDILLKMDKLLLMESEVTHLLLEAERTGKRQLNLDTGYYIAHGQSGVLVVWIIYQALPEGGFRVENVYAHRFLLDAGE